MFFPDWLPMLYNALWTSWPCMFTFMFDIDVDKSFDFYSFLKSKKMVNGIPVLLCYKKGNSTYIPDDMITGSDPQQLHQFFTRCGKHLMDGLSQNPKK
jgi:hypothetical protein